MSNMTAPPRIPRCGAFLRSARLRHGLDQAELARRAGTGQPAISRIERDLVSPSLETLNRLLEAMGETLMLAALPLAEPVAGAGNQDLGELLSGHEQLAVEERLEQAARMSEIAIDLAAQAES